MGQGGNIRKQTWRRDVLATSVNHCLPQFTNPLRTQPRRELKRNRDSPFPVALSWFQMSCPRVPESHGDRKKETLACFVPLIVHMCCEPSSTKSCGIGLLSRNMHPQARKKKKKKIRKELGSCVSSFFQLVNLPTFNSDTNVAQRFRKSQRQECQEKDYRRNCSNAM